VGQFLWWHEYPTGDARMIMDPDFPKMMESFIDDHNRVIQRSDSWESPHDPLQTDPVTGKSALSNQAIFEFMVGKYEKEIVPFLTGTKAFAQAKRDLESTKQNLESLERAQAVSLQERDVKADVEKMAQAKEAVEKAQTAYKKAIRDQIKTKKIVSDTGNFIDLHIKLDNGKRLKFSETTLRFKARNFEDTRGMLKAAGAKGDFLNTPLVNIESSLVSSKGLSSPLSEKDLKGSAAVTTSSSSSASTSTASASSGSSSSYSSSNRTRVMQTLRQATAAWKEVMEAYVEKMYDLATTTVDPKTGLTLDKLFSKGRLAAQKDLIDLLKRDRREERAVDLDYRDEADKKMFEGW